MSPWISYQVKHLTLIVSSKSNVHVPFWNVKIWNYFCLLCLLFFTGIAAYCRNATRGRTVILPRNPHFLGLLLLFLLFRRFTSCFWSLKQTKITQLASDSLMTVHAFIPTKIRNKTICVSRGTATWKSIALFSDIRQSEFGIVNHG